MNRNIRVFTALIVVATLFLGVAYASVSNISLKITGVSSALPYESIEITNVELYESSGVTTSNTNSYAKTLLTSHIELEKDKDAYVIYTVTIKNNTLKDLYFIEVVRNNSFYLNSSNDENTQIEYELIGLNEYDMLSSHGGEVTFDIKFKYNVANTLDILETNQILNSYLNFRYREIYTISYTGFTGQYPLLGIYGEDLIISFELGDIPYNVNVTGAEISSYENGILTLTNITGNVSITKIEEGD